MKALGVSVYCYIGRARNNCGGICRREGGHIYVGWDPSHGLRKERCLRWSRYGPDGDEPTNKTPRKRQFFPRIHSIWVLMCLHSCSSMTVALIFVIVWPSITFLLNGLGGLPFSGPLKQGQHHQIHGASCRSPPSRATIPVRLRVCGNLFS